MALNKRTSVVAGLIALLGLALIVTSLLWLRTTTDDGILASKQAFTKETTCRCGGRQRTTTETDYAEGLVIAALAIGASLVLTGAFFGRIHKVSVWGSGISLDRKQAEQVVEATVAATEATQKLAEAKAPPGKEEEVAKRAIS